MSDNQNNVYSIEILNDIAFGDRRFEGDEDEPLSIFSLVTRLQRLESDDERDAEWSRMVLDLAELFLWLEDDLKWLQLNAGKFGIDEMRNVVRVLRLRTRSLARGAGVEFELVQTDRGYCNYEIIKRVA